MVVLVALTQEAFMTNHENTQYRSSAGETTPLHESRPATLLQKLGKRSLKLLDTARLIYRYGFPLPPYREEGQPATSEEMSALNGVLSPTAAQAEAANAAPTHTAAHDSIDPSHHEAVLTHEGGTQDSAPSPKTHIYYDGELIKTQTFPQLYKRMLHQKSKTNQ